MQMVEHVGSGIKRMNDAMKLAGLVKPEYRTDGMFTVCFKRPVVLGEKRGDESLQKSTVKSTVKTPDKIIELIIQNAHITVPELAKILGLSISGIEKQLKKLKTNKRIERIGSAKGGHWKVVK